MGYDRRIFAAGLASLSFGRRLRGSLRGNRLNGRRLSLVSPTRRISIICRSRLRRDEATSAC